MKFLKTLIAGAALAASASAFSTPVNLTGPESPNLQQVINSLYTNCVDAGCAAIGNAPNVNANQSSEVGLFQVEASGGSVATMIIEVAGNSGSNTFGIYDPYNLNATVPLFGGLASGGSQALLSVTDTFEFSVNFGTGVQFTSSTFGYYLGTNAGVFYSQASLNGGDDHMVAFQGDGDKIKLPTRAAGVWGSSSYILAWEDLAFNARGFDGDYQDMVVYVESVTAVPEPGSLALLGLGLAGLAAVSRRKQKQA